MQVRAYSEADLGRIQELHRQSGFEYDFPNVASESFFSRRVICEQDRIAMAGFLRLTAEAFLICDPEWRNPAWRELALRNLQTVCRQDAAERGVSEVNAFIPPEVEKTFRARLGRLGWKRYAGEEWKCYSYEVQPKWHADKHKRLTPRSV